MTAHGYVHPDSLVSTSWVDHHRKDAYLRLIEVDVDPAAYGAGHIPGAIGWNWQRDLQRRPVRDIPTKTEWETLLSGSGIGNDALVVLYGDNHNWVAAFAFWLFRLYGHRSVCLMDGGRQKWLDEGRVITSLVPSYPATAYIAREANHELRAYRDDVAAAIGMDGQALVDVRSPKEFSGALLAPEDVPQEGAQRGGHIPGATNVPWAAAVSTDGTFKPAEELARLYGGKGITPNKGAVTYCRIGERSAHTWFVLTELLGYPDVRNYDGSWTEWGSLIGVPIER